jgi:hypothetical protein
MWPSVIDARVVIDVLPATNEIETGQCGLRVRGVQARVNARARQRAAERERMRGKTAGALLRSSDRRDMKRLRAFLLQPVVLHLCLFACDDAGNRIGPVLVIAKPYKVLDDHAA